MSLLNHDILEVFEPISLEEMESVSLMKRTDTKFAIPLSKLGEILGSIRDDYRILSIGGNRKMTYSSLYFDTGKNQFYKDHHNGKVNRLKIRIRNYVESQLYFLEIKQKNGKGITKKSRIPLKDFEDELLTPSLAFIEKVTKTNFELTPTLLNNFHRVTLVNIAEKERVTIDFDLSFSANDRMTEVDELVIFELKQERLNRKSNVFQTLRQHGYKPLSISKYCLGMFSLDGSLKQNRFKQKMRTLNKLLAA